MSKFAAILYDTLLEVRVRKIFYLYWLVTLVMVIFFLLLPNLEVNGADLFESGLLSPEMLDKAVAMFFDGLFGFMIFLMVFGSAGLVPSFLGKGRVELALSKPIDRFRLLTMKSGSVYLIMSGILVLTMTIVWAMLSVRLGATSWYFFCGLAFACLQFLTVYCIILFLGVLSNSAIVAIMGYFIIRVGSDLLASREIVYQFLGKSVWKTILDGLYHILPKIGEMSDNYGTLMQGGGISKAYPIYSTLGISAVIFLLTLLIFNRRDY